MCKSPIASKCWFKDITGQQTSLRGVLRHSCRADGLAACCRPLRKGEKRKGTNGSDPKVNCVTRRVRFCFWCFGQQTRFYPSGVKKYLEALSPESGAIGGGKGPEGELITGCLRAFSCAPCVGSCLECALGPGGSNARGTNLTKRFP